VLARRVNFRLCHPSNLGVKGLPDGAAQNCPACCLAHPKRTTSGPFSLPPTRRQPHLQPAFDGCYGCKVRPGYVNDAPATIGHFVGSVNAEVQKKQAPDQPPEEPDADETCKGACDRKRVYKCGNTASRMTTFDLNVLIAGVCSHVFPLVNCVVLSKRGGARTVLQRLRARARLARARPAGRRERRAMQPRCMLTWLLLAVRRDVSARPQKRGLPHGAVLHAVHPLRRCMPPESDEAGGRRPSCGVAGRAQSEDRPPSRQVPRPGALMRAPARLMDHGADDAALRCSCASSHTAACLRWASGLTAARGLRRCGRAVFRSTTRCRRCRWCAPA